jgi:hypothetical protein
MCPPDIEMCLWVKIGLSLLFSLLRLFSEDSGIIVLAAYRQVIPLFKSIHLFHCLYYPSLVCKGSVCLVE